MSVARCTDDFNGAQLKAVCVEAGMIALRREAEELTHEDYMDGEERERELYVMIENYSGASEQGHFGANSFVPYRKVVPISEVNLCAS